MLAPPIPETASGLAVPRLLKSAPAGTHAGADSGRFVVRTIPAEGGTRTLTVWLPPGFDPARRWPAIVFLHGSGECGKDGEKPTQIGLGPALRAHPGRWPFVVLFPQKPTEDEKWEEHEAQVFASLDEAARAFAVDTTRLALAGVSQGGHGAWMIAARHAARWKCLVAVCGYGRARTISGRVAMLPVWAFHGLRDDLVDPGDTRRIVAELKARKTQLGLDTTTVRMTLYPDANHNSWDPAFSEPELPVWIGHWLEAK